MTTHIGTALGPVEGGPAGAQYGGTNQPPPAGHGGPGGVAGLPFTGLDLGVMFAAGILLVAFGTALRRRVAS